MLMGAFMFSMGIFAQATSDHTFIMTSCGVAQKAYVSEFKTQAGLASLQQSADNWYCVQNNYCTLPSLKTKLSFDDIFIMKHGRTPTLLERIRLDRCSPVVIEPIVVDPIISEVAF